MSSTHHDGYNGVVEFKDYLLNEFWKWEKTTGKRQSMSAFALYLGVKQSAFAHWIGGNIIPSKENADKLAKKLGTGVYEVLGLPIPEGSDLPQPIRDAYEAAEERIKSLGIPKSSPEALQIYIDEVSKIGLTFIEKKVS